MSRRTISLVVAVAIAVGLAAWLFGAFDGGETPSSVPPSASAEAAAAATTSTATAATTSQPAPVMIPPTEDLHDELTGIGYAQDGTTGIWRATSSVGVPEFVLEGDKRVVEARLGNLVCDVPPTFERRPAALILLVMPTLDRGVPADTGGQPVKMELEMGGVVLDTFTCSRK